MAQDSPLPGMHPLINRRMDAHRARLDRKRLVEFRFLHIGFEAVDRLEGRGGVDGESVGSDAYVLPILEMPLVDSEMSSSVIGMPGEMYVRQTGEEGTGVFRERMEGETVDGEK
jgi:hypothetical protein